jgi:hypothetical protein
MNGRKTLAGAAATTLLAGFGTYTATTAFASSHTAPDRAPTTATATVTASRASDGKDTDTMIRRCAGHLPAEDRATAQKQMRQMMSGSGHMSGISMMDGTSGTSMHSMMQDPDGGS